MKTIDQDFKKSSKSVWTHCVEVKRGENTIEVRDSKNNGKGPVLSFNKGEWDAFIGGVRNDEFDV